MRRSPHARLGFTLVELMISIGIALLLMLGINIIFAAASQTVGAGNALLSSTRDARTVLQTLLNDLTSIDPVPAPGSVSGDAPFFIIYSQHQLAFLTPSDQSNAENQSDPSTDATLFHAFGDTFPVAMIGDRGHRVDRLAFFARTLNSRQTSGGTNQFVSPTAGNELFVSLGHAQMPNPAVISNAAAPNGWNNPGAGTSTSNVNNYFACDWMLSRLAVILSPNSTDGNVLTDGGGLLPLTSQSLYLGASDLALIKMATYSAANRVNGLASYVPNQQNANTTPRWYEQIIDNNYRLRASPYLLPGANSKITPGAMANCAPDLIRGCSQFIVEYAGNYYTKNADGSAVATTNAAGVSAPVPDPTGILDFTNVPVPDATSGTMVPRIRWYGFPRMTSGRIGTVSAANGDVAPLRDTLEYLHPGWGVFADAERFKFSSANQSPLPAAGSNYWSALNVSTDKTTPYTYAAAWGPDVQTQPFPKLIRITIEISDREGRLKQPQRYEFIFEVQK